MPAIQNGSTEKVVSILSNLWESLPTSHKYRDNATEADVVTEPVSETGKTSYDVEMDTSESAKPTLDSLTVTDCGGNNGATAVTPVFNTRKTSFDGDNIESAPIDGPVASESHSVRRSKRKRRQEFKSGPCVHKKQRSKIEGEGEGGRGGEEEGGREGENVAERGRERDGISTASVVMKEKGPVKEGVGFDVNVVMETDVNNCNILHVCCGGEEGFMVTFEPNLGEWKSHMHTLTCTHTHTHTTPHHRYRLFQGCRCWTEATGNTRSHPVL